MNFQQDHHIDILRLNKRDYKFINLPYLFGPRLSQLPITMRLLLENVIRNTDRSEHQQTIDSFSDWLISGNSHREIPYHPGRVLMHDTTSTPALVDMAAMRDSLAEVGIDPSSLNPVLPVDVSVDHSLAVEAYAEPGAAEKNLKMEMRRNHERYRFLRWASKAFKNVHINPPGTGIMHTINMEQLATVVKTETRNGHAWVIPDTMLGTDSHTPMINGIGVLGWGVGGLEAQSVMFGIPTMLRIPEVVGVKLIGELGATAQATDLALTVTQRLRALNVTGEFVEFFGPGVTTLTADDRCVVANMAPEYGATSGFFAIDTQTLDYLRRTGRSDDQISMIETYSKQNGLWFDPQAQPRYTRRIEINLSTIGIQAAGPQRPQDLLDFGKIPQTLAALNFQPKTTSDLPRHPVAIAAITSCTNTTSPHLLISAGLLARNANKYGLRVPEWVKTSLAPGSPAAATYLKRAGLIEELSAIGFDIVGYGCTSCIGNSGPLTKQITNTQKEGKSKAVAILSGNRNFPGRVHPDLELGFIMSPTLVTAFALCGDAERDLASEPIQNSRDGDPIFLKDLWPSKEEIDSHVAMALNPLDFERDFKIASTNPAWDEIETPETDLFPWDKCSNTLRRPPFTNFSTGNTLGHYTAYPLMLLGDDVTTDHISPASAIPEDSFIADFLVANGEKRNDLNVFASRRGNWEVMMRGAFFNKSLTNHLAPEAPVGQTLHIPSQQIKPIWVAAQDYHEANDSVVIIAGERYGMGSSRDWAAKGQKLLNIRAVLAFGFERIHRSNLIGMGILPLLLPKEVSPELKIGCDDRIEISVNPQSLIPHSSVPIKIFNNSEVRQSIKTTAAIETGLEVQLLLQGGVIPSILRKLNISTK